MVDLGISGDNIMSCNPPCKNIFKILPTTNGGENNTFSVVSDIIQENGSIKVVKNDGTSYNLDINGSSNNEVIFGDGIYIVNLYINGIRLLFREITNSNKTMVITGIFHNGAWQGDAPDGENINNPFK